MKNHERCSISGSVSASEIPLLSSIPYLFGKTGIGHSSVLDFGVKGVRLARARPAPTTVSGGEFDWGGTSVKS